MKRARSIMGMAGIGLCATASLGLAQGSLNPPGGPSPTMKTLAQIEPRTPITNAPVTLSVTGSYYLTTNLTVTAGDAITIATGGVTLDLNGFTIASTAPIATGNAILLQEGLSDITIFNGHIRGGVTNNGSGAYSGSGFQSGIRNLNNLKPVNTRVAGVSVAGCSGHGISLGHGAGNSTVVESCTVRTVGGMGIVANTIRSSVAVDCASWAITGDEVADSRGECTGSTHGLWSEQTALNCFGKSSGGIGLLANTAQNCSGISGTGTGLQATTAQNCCGSSSVSIGLQSITAQNCKGECTIGASHGVEAEVAFNCLGSSFSGIGLRFTKLGAMCRGERVNSAASNYVLGGGMAGPVNLP